MTWKEFVAYFDPHLWQRESIWRGFECVFCGAWKPDIRVVREEVRRRSEEARRAWLRSRWENP